MCTLSAGTPWVYKVCSRPLFMSELIMLLAPANENDGDDDEGVDEDDDESLMESWHYKDDDNVIDYQWHWE